MFHLDALPVDLSLLLPTVFGLAGFTFYTVSKLALSLRYLTSEGLTYYVLTGTAACLISLSLLPSFNIGVFLTQAITFATSVIAIALRLRCARRRAAVLVRVPIPQFKGLSGARPMPARPGSLGCALFPDRID
jgi:hypothetical protein